MNNSINIAIAWFKKSDWEEWKKISPKEIEDTFDKWLAEVKKLRSSLEKDGYHVVQVTITPKEFLNWCKQNNKKPDSKSRSLYVLQFSRN